MGCMRAEKNNLFSLSPRTLSPSSHRRLTLFTSSSHSLLTHSNSLSLPPHTLPSLTRCWTRVSCLLLLSLVSVLLSFSISPFLPSSRSLVLSFPLSLSLAFAIAPSFLLPPFLVLAPMSHILKEKRTFGLKHLTRRSTS